MKQLYSNKYLLKKRGDLHPWGKGERFPHSRNCLHWLRDQLGQAGSFRGSEESSAPGLRKAGQRDKDRWSFLPSCTSQPKTCACWYVQWLGDKTRASLERSRERIHFGCMETAQRTRNVVQAATGGVHKMEPGLHRRSIVNVKREGCGPTIADSSQYAHRGCCSTTRNSESMQELPGYPCGGRAEI